MKKRAAACRQSGAVPVLPRYRFLICLHTLAHLLPYTVRLLGGFHIAADQEPATGLDRARLQELLAYLLIP
jgi:hypothetical protein